MITRKLLLICFCFVLITPTNIAGAKAEIDCKKIDHQKFKELFKFDFGGGQKGLYLDFDFVSKTKDIFRVENCEFLLKETKTLVPGAKSYKKQSNRRKLNTLNPCTKYDVVLTIQNIATKKEFTYQNIVFTKVDYGVTKLDMKVDKMENNSAKLSWTSLTASCIISHKVNVINSKNASVFEDVVADSFVVVKDLSTCEIYTAQVIAFSANNEEISSPPKTFILNSQETFDILELRIDEVLSDSVNLSWISDSPCPQEYQINLRNSDDKIIYGVNVFKNSIVISSLTSCSNYSVELIALDDNKAALKTVIKTFFTHSHSIDNVKVKVNESKARISWTPPTKLDCIENYNITYIIDDCNFRFDENISCSHSEIIDKSSSSHTFHSLPLAERFSLTIYANESTSGDGDSRQAKNLTFNTIDYGKFFVQNINEFRLEKTKLQLSWSIDNFFLKILDHFEIFIEENLLTSEKAFIALDIAACKQNYSVVIYCISKDGTRGPDVSYQTNLNDDDVPLSSLIKSVEYKQLNETIIVSWAPRKEEESCVAFYEIDFNHQSFKTSDTKTEINDFAPCITYEINITPISHYSKRGVTSTFEFTTEEFFPKPPKNLELVDSGSKDLTLSAMLSDDDKQCKSTAVEFLCDNFTLIVNAEVLTSKYVGKITGLSPFSSYNCSARVLNKRGVSNRTEAQQFATKQDGPQPPMDIIISVNEDNSIVAQWTADNSTGYAKLFKIYVTFEKTIYEIPPGCDIPPKKTKIYEQPETNIELINLEPFSKYSLKIVAVNDYGVSSHSKKQFFNTKPSPSSPPRDISMEFIDNRKDTENISITLKWNPPCNLNGFFSIYTISLKGRRSGCSDHIITEASSYENLTVYNLKQGYNYNVKIQASSSGFTGLTESFFFTATSGIPSEEDLRDWTTFEEQSFEHGQAEIFIKRGIFTSKIGDVVGIAFLVFLANCPDPPQPTHGYLRSENISLPSTYETKDGLECFELYQQTDILPNPLIEQNINDGSVVEDYSIKFMIGDEICANIDDDRKYCNVYLSPNKYGLMARLFTNNGYRDTQPVYIDVQLDPYKLISPNTIVYGSVSAVIFLSLIILLCCLWSNKAKKKKLLKEKQAAEADENLLSFTSYCVIDKNPIPRKKYDDL